MLIRVPEGFFSEGFNRPFTEEEKDRLIKSIGGDPYLCKELVNILEAWSMSRGDKARVEGSNEE